MLTYATAALTRERKAGSLPFESRRLPTVCTLALNVTAVL